MSVFIAFYSKLTELILFSEKFEPFDFSRRRNSSTYYMCTQLPSAIPRTIMTQRFYSVKGYLSNSAENNLNFARVFPYELLLFKEIM